MEMKKTFMAVMLACLPLLSEAQSTEIACWKIDGTQMKLTTEESVLKIPDMVAAVDLRHIGAITLDCASANPNCLYYTDDATAVEGLPNANVVCDGVCDGLLLTDDTYFYCPIDFTATDAMLRFTPRRDDGYETADFNQPCHETVVLPFDADLVIPSDADGPMPNGWLQAANYSGHKGRMLIFSQTGANTLFANTPYMVRFEYAAYGSQILFCGQNKTVRKTVRSIHGSDPLYFIGITILDSAVTSFFRYYRGQKQYFISSGENSLLEPFRCFMFCSQPLSSEDGDSIDEVPTGTSWGGQILEYTVVDYEGTGINILNHHPSPNTHHPTPNTHHPSPKIYDLQGRQQVNGRNGKGIYIIGGIKVLR